MGSVFGCAVNCLVFSLVLQILIPLPTVKCGRKGSLLILNWELLKLISEVTEIPSRIITKIRDHPFVLMLRLYNDLLEPVVNTVEIVRILEDLDKKFKGNKKVKDLKNWISNENQFKVNQNINQLELQNMKVYNDFLNEKKILTKQSNSGFSPLTVPESAKIGLSKMPERIPNLLKSSQTRDPNYFQNDLVFENSQNNYNYVRNLPKDYPINNRNSIKNVNNYNHHDNNPDNNLSDFEFRIL